MKTDIAPLVQWNASQYSTPPVVFPAPGFSDPDIQALFLLGLPWRGKPTHVFAWMGLPRRPVRRPCPGMILLHGGGGTAFVEWVRLWNARGYAAIAIDQCGAVPPRPGQQEAHPRERHAHGGPPGWIDSFHNVLDPIEDQWPYHAVAACLRAHTLLATQPGVDADRIGVTGISWGGYLTCLVAGVDPRLKCAIPVYGCGYLGHESAWKDGVFQTLPPGHVQRWLELWDASRYLPEAHVPFCWVSGTNDNAYPLPSLQRSYGLAPGPRTLCIRVTMPHSHPAGWSPGEIGAFADSVLCDAPALPRLAAHGRDGLTVHARFDAPQPLVRAELNYTRALGHWTDRRWNTVPARLDPATGRVDADLPPRATVWYLNVYDHHNQLVSTPHEEVLPS